MADEAAAARDAIAALLGRRAPEATICPSEVARMLAAGGSSDEAWRDKMPVVHAVVDALLADGVVRLSWRGQPLPARTGPYRIGRDGRDRGVG